MSASTNIKIITSGDAEAVLNFLRRFYFTDEPLNEAAGVLTDGLPTPDLEKDAIHEINHGVSLMKVNDSGEIIAVLLSSIVRKGNSALDENCSNKNFLKIVKFLNFTDDECNIFGRYPGCDKFLLHKMYCVDKAERGRGAGVELLTKARDIAKTLGILLFRMDTTNFYCARVAEKQGFTCVYSLKYEDYKVEGEVVFAPKSPHTEFKIFTLNLNPEPEKK